MEKQVFESFDEFVKFVYEAANLNESENFEDIKALLSDLGLNSKNSEDLSRAEELVAIGDETKSAGYNTYIKAGKGVSTMANDLGNFFRYLRSKKAEIEVKGSAGTIAYNNLLGGKFLNSDSQRESLAVKLANVNSSNAKAKSYLIPYVDDKDREWKEAKKSKSTAAKLTGGLIGWDNKTGFIDGSGILGQVGLTNVKGTLEFENSPKELAKTPGLPAFFYTETEASNAGSIYDSTILFYYIDSIIPGGGADYSVTDIKPVEIIKSKTTEEFTPIALDSDSLFEVNKSELKPKAAEVIKVAMNGLVSASDLVVTGYASQEGTPERNKTLCEERGKVIADFITKNYPSLGAVKVEPFNAAKHIQPKSGSEAERPQWRKVTITGKGTRLAQVPTEYKEIVYKEVNGKMRADKVLIGQLSIGVRASL